MIVNSRESLQRVARKYNRYAWVWLGIAVFGVIVPNDWAVVMGLTCAWVSSVAHDILEALA